MEAADRTRGRGLRGSIRWPLLAALQGIAGAALACAPAPEQGVPERIVLLVVDTLRRDRLSPYGAETATPNIQALADRGQTFTNVLSAFHQTSMSMGALFTGRTPSIESAEPGKTLFWNRLSWCGLARFARDGDPPACIPHRLPTLAERLRDAGYWTIGIASNEFLYEPFGYSRGFEDWVEVGRQPGLPVARQKPPEGGAAAPAAPAAPPAEWTLVRWPFVNRAAVSAVARRPRDRFFLYVHYMDVHDHHFERRPYDEAVASVDEAVGRLLGRLEQAGLLEDAVVLLTSDHGERLDEKRPVRSGRQHNGNPSFQELLRVPLIAAPAIDPRPDRFLRGQDLYRLILGIAGVASESEVELEADEHFVGEVNFRTYVKGRWKSMQHRAGNRFHLFDLESDPDELHDVAARHPDRVAAHRLRVEALSRRLETQRELGERLSTDEERRLRALGYLE